MFSVENEEEAEALLTLACGTNLKGQYVAKELALHQNMSNLTGFSERLERLYNQFIKKEKENG